MKRFLTASLSALILASGVLGLTRAFGDGDPELDVLLIKTVLPLLLTADLATGQIPLDLNLNDRVAWLNSVLSLSAVTNLLKDVWDPVALQSHATEWVSALQAVATDAGYRAYDLNSVVVTQWQNVTISGDNATVLFLGHPRYHTADGWVDDPDDQYQVTLKHSTAQLGLAAGWRLVDYIRIDSSNLASAGGQ